MSAVVPALHTTWADWKAEHPETVALVKGYAGAYDGYSGYYRSSHSDFGTIGRAALDTPAPTAGAVWSPRAGE